VRQSLSSAGLPLDAFANQLNSIIHNGYRRLYLDEIITDPVIESIVGFGIAILPFVPFSIVKRTNKGRVVYRKIQAALWKYERTKTTGGHVQTNLTLEAARIARVIKTSLIAGWHEATKPAEGDEPEDEPEEGPPERTLA